MKEKIGQYMIRLDLLSFEQAEAILKIQKRCPRKPFGQIALEQGYVTKEDLEEAVASQPDLLLSAAE